MLRVGLIGVGSISQVHRNAYNRLAKQGADVVLEACCDVRPERLVGLGDVRLYTDVDAMLEAEKGKLDYVDICVPTFLHAEISIKAMRAGFHVLCEKPMARTVAEAEAMIAVSKETGKTLMSAYCNRFYTAARTAKELIDSGKLGTVRSAEFVRTGGPCPSGWNMWFRDGALSGGAPLDLHIHDVDMIRWMFGMPKSVSMVAKSTMTKDGYDYLTANLIYDDFFVHTTCDWTTMHDKFNTRMIRVNFTNGYIFIDRSAGREAFVMVDGEGNVTDYTADLAFDAYYNEVVYFTQCLAQEKPVLEALPEETADSVRIVMAEIESADRGGEKIDL